MLKKILLSVLVVIIVGVFAVGLYLDSIAAAAIEKVGTRVLKTEVSVGDIDISLFSKQISLSGLTIKNPEGFQTEDFLKLDTASVKASEPFGNPVIVDSVLVDGLIIAAEMVDGRSNIQAIQRNLAKPNAPAAAEADDAASEPKKVVIKDMTIQNAEVVSALSLAGQGESVTVPLPKLNITNLGTENSAITAPEAAERIMTAITSTAAQSVNREFWNKASGEAVEGIKGEVTKQLEGLGESLDGLLGN